MSYQEKRREPRLEVAGNVRFRPVESNASEFVDAHLLDISLHGFRAAHSSPGLTSGQDVLFQHAHAKGRARVAWNRIVDGSVETGFYILEG